MELQAALTPDGDIDRLQRLYRDLVQQHPRAIAHRRGGAAELGLLASRLGKDEQAQQWLERALGGGPGELPSPANTVLAWARIGDIDRAVALLDSMQHPPRPALSRDAAELLRTRLERARTSRTLSQDATGVERARLAAAAEAELGAYLRGLELLAPEVRDTRPSPALVLYVQLLVAARLDQQAHAILEQTEGSRASTILRQIRGNLPVELQRLPSVPKNRAWTPGGTF
jgi:hypothetical protein